MLADREIVQSPVRIIIVSDLGRGLSSSVSIHHPHPRTKHSRVRTDLVACVSFKILILLYNE